MGTKKRKAHKVLAPNLTTDKLNITIQNHFFFLPSFSKCFDGLVTNFYHYPVCHDIYGVVKIGHWIEPKRFCQVWTIMQISTTCSAFISLVFFLQLWQPYFFKKCD